MTEEKKFPHRFGPGNEYRITTTERSRELRHLGKLQKARSKLKGLADLAAHSINVDEMTDEELINAAGDTVRALTRHMAEQFIDSKNVRGLAESYSKLVDALAEEERNPVLDVPPGVVSASVTTLLELASQLDAEVTRRREQERAIVIDA